ncbi:MAG: hypothetical protein ABI333_26340 [bacterium]
MQVVRLSRLNGRAGLLLAAALVALPVLGCEEKKDSAGGGGGAGGQEPSGPVCKQGLFLKSRFSAADGVALATSFKATKTVAWISGRRYDAKATAKHAYIAFANYDVKLGPTMIELPKKPGEVAVVVSIKTANQEVPLAGQRAVYGKLAVPTGAFPFGVMDPKQSYSVSVYLGGSSGGKVVSGQRPRGKAIVTHSSPKHLCGSLGFRSGSGTFLKGEFNLPITRDLWAKP